jgi:hypothetical protein
MDDLKFNYAINVTLSIESKRVLTTEEVFVEEVS